MRDKNRKGLAKALIFYSGACGISSVALVVVDQVLFAVITMVITAILMTIAEVLDEE